MKSNLRNIVMSLAMLFAAAGQAVAGHATAEMSTNAVTASADTYAWNLTLPRPRTSTPAVAAVRG
ncbi:MAG: hypothetical protein AABY62_09095 [Pseudomonadota bacterium]